MVENNATIMFEDARLIYKNFTGRESQFNAEGDKNFCVVLDEETAQVLVADEWNVKWTKPRRDATPTEIEEFISEPYLPVFLPKEGKGRPPKIVLVTQRGRSILEFNQTEMLDWATITNVDFIARAYVWSMPNGTGGVKAQLKTMYVTIEEDELETKYSEQVDA